MRLGLLLLILLLAGCAPVENTFEVEVSEEATAELHLCGKAQALTRLGQKLSIAFPITCEGDGEIIVTLADRASVSCGIGYVTPGAVQNFSYRIEGDQCIAVF